ncbi:hypothetical protein D9757_004970 [Collybiopsis confluens]|uniref:Uncharacterized protein n=1 Tax=Collybiopsis confluens TaxID=2823264 RepID=A0A8H5MCX5_9AGAR|nr:hypothetical protein D9757_004970 [Collybiopsis confluens]
MRKSSVIKKISAPVDALAREIDVFLGFSWRDWSTTIIPGSLFIIGAIRTLPDEWSMIRSYLCLIFWLTSWVYFFTLSNQIVGVEEDRINKPDRPLPSGKVTLAGAKKRWLVAFAAFASNAIFNLSLTVEVIVWILTTATLTVTPLGNHWFVKSSLAMATGTWALLRGSWKSIIPLTPETERYVLAISFWMGLLTQIQDLRDIEGDTATGRYTLPIAAGDLESRLIISYIFMPLSLLGLWVGGILPLAPVLLFAAHIFMGYRVLQSKNGPRYDHKTYMVHTYTFCLVLGITAIDGQEGMKVLLCRLPSPSQ